jgi:hypothetical protein
MMILFGILLVLGQVQTRDSRKHSTEEGGTKGLLGAFLLLASLHVQFFIYA